MARLLRQADRHKGQGPLSHLMTGIAVCDTCKGPIRAIRSRWAHEDGEFEDMYACRRGHASLPVEWVDGQVLRRMVKRAVENGKANFGEEKPTEQTEPLIQREREIGELLAELGEDRAANPITRESMIAATMKYNAELAEIQAKLAEAGRGGAWEFVNTEPSTRSSTDTSWVTSESWSGTRTCMSG